jgi:hypothetical protein
MRFTFAAAALLVLACSKPQPSATSAGTTSPPPPTPEVTSSSSPPPPTAALPTAAPTEVERPILPPSEPGKANVSLAGCLAEKDKPTSSSRSMKPDQVILTPTGLGLTLRHQLQHNCCAEAQVQSELDGHDVRIVEHMTGEVCRCMCNSVIRAAVRLPPGTYQVTLSQIDASGKETKLHEQELAVTSLRK